MAELKRFEYIIEFEPYALQNKDELCFKSKNVARKKSLKRIAGLTFQMTNHHTRKDVIA